MPRTCGARTWAAVGDSSEQGGGLSCRAPAERGRGLPWAILRSREVDCRAALLRSEDVGCGGRFFGAGRWIVVPRSLGRWLPFRGPEYMLTSTK